MSACPKPFDSQLTSSDSLATLSNSTDSLRIYHPNEFNNPDDLNTSSQVNPSPKETFGLVAGWGEYPQQVLQALKRSGYPTVVAAIHAHASEDLEPLADALEWFGVCKLGRMQRFFHAHGVTKVCLAGKLFKDRILYHGSLWLTHAPDTECIRTFIPSFLSRRENTTDDTLLGAIVQSFHRKGMHVVPGTDYATELIAEEGVLTNRRPNARELADIEFGWNIAKQIGGLDIGQSITVKNRSVLAVEAVEGTDACIERTGTLCPVGGWTLVKVAKPQQDMRFDLPTIGPLTIERIANSGGSAIAIEAGKTIVLDRPRTLALANRKGISILSKPHAVAQSLTG